MRTTVLECESVHAYECRRQDVLAGEGETKVRVGVTTLREI